LISLLIYTYNDINKNEKLFIKDYILSPGQNIKQFYLKNSNDQEFDFHSLIGNKTTGVFILPKPCLPCNSNYFFLKKLTRLPPEELKSIWIIYSGQKKPDNLKFHENNNIKFFYPSEPEKFSRAFKLDFTIPQTTILSGQRVIFTKTGELSTQDYFNIKKIIKGAST
jgi:hypothetical protein